MVERLAAWEVTIYHTDKWGTYAAVLPAEKLVMSKTGTGRMEWNHCRQRHWFGRFKRKSIIVSKSQGDGGSHHGAFCELLGEWESSRTSITTLLKLSFHYYHHWRTHRALDMDCPLLRPVQRPEVGLIRAVPEVGGLHHHYERRAA
jgi:IS1 transposase